MNLNLTDYVIQFNAESLNMDATIQSESAIKHNTVFNLEFNQNDNIELEEVYENSIIPEQIYINPEDIPCRPSTPPLITIDSLPEFRFECDFCDEDVVSGNLIRLFKHRRTHNSYNIVNFIKNNNFQKSCFYCPLQLDCMIFQDGYLSVQKVKTGLQSSCDFCQKSLFSIKHFNHECYLCNISSIMTCDDLVWHLKNVHNSEKPFRCVICGLNYTNLSNLKRHLRHHTANRYHKCELCPKRFYQEKNLKYHRYVHTNERNFACHLCDKRFMQPRNLRQHMIVHSNIRYGCHICPKFFLTKIKLKYHVRKHIIPSVKQYQCDQCPKAYVRKSGLDYHKFSHTLEANEKRFKCDQCSKAYNYKQDLDYHKYVHTGEKPYVCNLCGKQFTKPDYLKYHQYSHLEGKQFECELCNKKYSSPHTLKQHLKNVHDRPESKPYQCDLCDKKYSGKRILSNHRKVHTGEPLFECKFCDKKFVHPTSLRSHLDRHKKEQKL